MKTLQMYLLPTVFLLSLTLIMGCTQTEGPAAQEETSIVEGGSLFKGGPSANGQGSLTFDGVRRIFAFHANTHPNGSVSGNGVLNRVSSDPNDRVKIEFDIDCLSVSGDVAIMSGTTTKLSFAPDSVVGPFGSRWLTTAKEQIQTRTKSLFSFSASLMTLTLTVMI